MFTGTESRALDAIKLGQGIEAVCKIVRDESLIHHINTVTDHQGMTPLIMPASKYRRILRLRPSPPLPPLCMLALGLGKSRDGVYTRGHYISM